MNPLYFHFVAAACTKPSFFGFPTWYQYLPQQTASSCSPSLGSLSDVWLIVAAIIEILLRVASLVAVAFVIYGAVKYMTSQGSPDATNQARSSIQNAIIGLFIAVSAAAIVQFVAGRIH